MPSRNVEALRAAYENWNRRNFDGALQLVADNCTYTDNAQRETIHGRQNLRAYLANWAKAWSDGKIKDARFIDAGDMVIAEFTGEGTNDGPFGGLPPTNRHVSFPFCEIWQFDKTGRMISGSCYYDLYSILIQLGHLRPLSIAA